jgi:ABC-2 type transport system permease protein
MNALVGTVLLTRHAFRRDRILATTWVVVLALTCYASAAATSSLYPSMADRVSAAEAINSSPAIVALYGPILDVRSLGELAMTKMTVLYAVFVAIMCLVLVRRHTRVEEENGQTELIGGTAVGRDAPLASAVVEAGAVALVLGLVSAGVNIVAGLPVAGSLAFGASWAGVGLTSVGMTAVACQLSASARTCAAIAAGMLGFVYLLRAVGDTSVSWLSWLSPLGWSTQLRAYSGTRWWVLLLYVALAAALVGAAQVLRARRDLGSGLLAARPGPAHGSPRLADAVALSLRVHGSMLWIWSVSTASMGVVFGAIAPNIGDLLDSPSARQMIERLGGEGVLEETLIAAELSILAVVVTCFAIAVVGHGGADEHDGRTEQVLATATSRLRAFVATTLVALVGSAWLLLVTGIALSLGYGGVGGGLGTAFGDIVPAALVQVPAVWVVTALAAACFALRSSWTVLAWGLLVLFLTLGQLGELVKLPTWVIDLSPYTNVPTMPVEPFSAAPVLILTAIAAAVLATAGWRYRSRDIG